MMRTICVVLVSLSILYRVGPICAYIGDLILSLTIQDVVQNIDGSTGLESDTGSEALVVDILDELLGAGLLVGLGRGFFGGGRVDGGFVVETVQVATCVLELLDPLLWLLASISIACLVSGVDAGNNRPRRSSCGNQRFPCRASRWACRREDGSW